MWYNDFLLVMLLVVLTLLVFAALLVAVKMKDTSRQKVDSTLRESVETPKTDSDVVIGNKQNGKELYDKIYSEPETMTEHFEEISVVKDSALIEDTDKTEIELNREEPLSRNFINKHEINDDLYKDEIEEDSRSSNLSPMPYYDNKLLITKSEDIKVNYQEVNEKPEEQLKQPVTDYPEIEEPEVEDSSLQFNDNYNVEDKSNTDEDNLYFNLQPQSLDHPLLKEPTHTDEVTFPKREKVEEYKSLNSRVEYVDEHKVVEATTDNGKPPVNGVMICPHCKAKVPSTLYCIICGRPMKE